MKRFVLIVVAISLNVLGLHAFAEKIDPIKKGPLIKEAPKTARAGENELFTPGERPPQDNSREKPAKNK